VEVHSGIVEECQALTDFMMLANSQVPPMNPGCIPACYCVCDQIRNAALVTIAVGYVACLTSCVTVTAIQCALICIKSAPLGPLAYLACMAICPSTVGSATWIVCSTACAVLTRGYILDGVAVYGACYVVCAAGMP